MLIELRADDTKGYLVDGKTKASDAWCWISFTSTDPLHLAEEIGSGPNLFLFEGAGRCAPAVVAILHAHTKEDAEEMIQERYGDRIRNRTLIRKHGLRELIDERATAG